MKEYIPFIKNTLIKIALFASAGGPFVLGDSLFAMICGGSVIASVLASSVGDKNFKPLMTLINHIAGNIDKAENNPDKQSKRGRINV